MADTTDDRYVARLETSLMEDLNRLAKDPNSGMNPELRDHVLNQDAAMQGRIAQPAMTPEGFIKENLPLILSDASLPEETRARAYKLDSIWNSSPEPQTAQTTGVAASAPAGVPYNPTEIANPRAIVEEGVAEFTHDGAAQLVDSSTIQLNSEPSVEPYRSIVITSNGPAEVIIDPIQGLASVVVYSPETHSKGGPHETLNIFASPNSLAIYGDGIEGDTLRNDGNGPAIFSKLLAATREESPGGMAITTGELENSINTARFLVDSEAPEAPTPLTRTAEITKEKAAAAALNQK